MKKIFIILEILLFFTIAHGVQNEQTAESVRKDLEKIRTEIEILEKKIQKEQKREKVTERSIQSLGKEIYERKRLIRKYSSAEKQTERSIGTLRQEISAKKKEIVSLQGIAKKRIVHLYKYGRTNEIEAILSSESFSQALVRIKYIMFFVNRDKKYIDNIKDNVDELQQKNDTLLNDLAYQKRIVQKKKNESASLSKMQQSEKRKKAQITSNLKTDSAELKKREAYEKKYIKLIAELSRKRRTPSAALPPVGTPFANLKGKLMWPVKGTVSSHFGINYNSKLKTRLNNLGVDIKAALGANVHSVWHGRILSPQWLPGFGTILIIEHDNGYLTCYAHLSEILVDLEEIVYPGKVIARVGDSESFDGAKLNFQIWKDGKNLNPERWLGRKRISVIVEQNYIDIL